MTFDWGWKAAADLIERALQTRDPGLTVIKGSPWLAQLVDEPRYQAVVHSVGLP